MKRKQLIILLLCFSSKICFSQGIIFEKSLSWTEIKAKALSSNKLIMLDVMASWCGPCKEMTANAFQSKQVSELVNANFIAVQIQTDKPIDNSKFGLDWYNQAQKLLLEYKISGYPTILYFSSDGNLIHKSLGSKNEQQLMQDIQIALNPNKQYTALLAKYPTNKVDLEFVTDLFLKALQFRDTTNLKFIGNDILKMLTIENFQEKKYLSLIQLLVYLANDPNNGFDNITLMKRYKEFMLEYEKGNRNSSFVRGIARLAVILKDKSVANSIAENYITGISAANLYLKENLEFIREFTKSSKDFGFNLFYKNTKRADLVMGNFSATGTVVFIIYKEEIYPFAPDPSAKPDWIELEKKVTAKYGFFGQEAFYKAKIIHLGNNQDWPNYIATAIPYLNRFKDHLSANELNTAAWNLFEHETNKKNLRKALKWSEKCVKKEYKSAFIDTYACLLYKLGEKDKAIEWETKASLLDSKPYYAETLLKMTKGQFLEEQL